MLVSSIGYFQGKGVNYTVKNQCNKGTLSEGFGHDFETVNSNRPKSNIITNFVKVIREVFSKENMNKRDCLSLLA